MDERDVNNWTRYDVKDFDQYMGQLLAFLHRRSLSWPSRELTGSVELGSVFRSAYTELSTLRAKYMDEIARQGGIVREAARQAEEQKSSAA